MKVTSKVTSKSGSSKKPAPAATAAAKSKKKSGGYSCSTSIFTPPDKPGTKIPMFYVHPVDAGGDVKKDVRLVALSRAKVKILLGFLDELQEFAAAE